VAERIAFHTGKSLAQIEADSDRNAWFTAQEAWSTASLMQS